jgi:hypothetical protein
MPVELSNTALPMRRRAASVPGCGSGAVAMVAMTFSLSEVDDRDVARVLVGDVGALVRRVHDDAARALADQDAHDRAASLASLGALMVGVPSASSTTLTTTFDDSDTA